MSLPAKNKEYIQDNVLFVRERDWLLHMDLKLDLWNTGTRSRFCRSLAAFPFHVHASSSPDLRNPPLHLLFHCRSTGRDIITSHSKMVMLASKQWTIGILLLSFLSIDLLIGETFALLLSYPCLTRVSFPRRGSGGTFGAESSKVAKGAASSLQDKEKAGREKVKCKEHIDEALRKYWDHGNTLLMTFNHEHAICLIAQCMILIITSVKGDV